MRTMLKSKIHRATVTGADINYEGSITLDPALMDAADIMPYEQVQILDVNNGSRLTTYAIEGEPDSGDVIINGAAARLVNQGDIVIILTYADVAEETVRDYKPSLVYGRRRQSNHPNCRADCSLVGRGLCPAPRTVLSTDRTERSKMDNRISIMDLKAKKKRGERIVMITCYDYPSARLLEAADVDILFIGDTLGMTVLGYDSTIPVTMDEMLHHTKAVVRGSSSAHVLADMPFMSYQTSPEDALRNAGRLLKEGGAQSVKLEGGVRVAETVRFIVDAGIPVMGHIGLTPQSINQLGGYKVQGKTPASAVRLVNDAVALERAGAYAIVLECVPLELAKTITDRLAIPTIGIGAGPNCDGQVQVFHDLLGLFDAFVPRHAKRYADLGTQITQAVRAYANEVRQGSFPTEKESFLLDKAVFSEAAEIA